MIRLQRSRVLLSLEKKNRQHDPESENDCPDDIWARLVSPRPRVPYLIAGLPIGLLVVLFVFVLAPLADFPLDAQSKASALIFALAAIIVTGAADYSARAERREREGRGFEWRTISPEELRRTPVPLLFVVLAVPLLAGILLNGHWYGVPFGFAAGALCAVGLMAYTQNQTRRRRSQRQCFSL